MSSLRRSRGVHITKNTVNFIYHLKKPKNTCYKGSIREEIKKNSCNVCSVENTGQLYRWFLGLISNPYEDWADLSGDEAAEVGVNIFHKSHIQQREARLHRRQDVCMAGKRMIPPLWLSPKDSLWQTNTKMNTEPLLLCRELNVHPSAFRSNPKIVLDQPEPI